MAKSPTQRALADIKSFGWTYQVVEYWNAFAKKRVDLFGCGDILALDGQPGALLIQVSSDSGHSARVKKTLAEPRILEWLTLGNRFSVWTYGLRGAKGTKKTWKRRETVVTEEMYK